MTITLEEVPAEIVADTIAEAPEWLREAMRDLVLGQVEVIGIADRVGTPPGMYRDAAEVAGMRWLWKWEPAGRWKLVSYFRAAPLSA
jgi:hypothetical protein